MSRDHEKGTGSAPKGMGRLPFQDFVEAKKTGVPVDMYPLSPGVRPRRHGTINPNQIRGVLVLLAIVVGIMTYLGVFSPRATTKDSAVGLEAVPEAVLEPVATLIPGHTVTPAIRASQYLDPSTEGHYPDTRTGTLRYGDFLTVMPQTRGVRFLYFTVLGPSDKFKLTRIYPPSLLESSPPPRKFALKSKKEGPFQVMLLGTQENMAERLQVLIQQANMMFGATSADDRQARVNRLMADISAELAPSEWAYYVLDEVPYKP